MRGMCTTVLKILRLRGEDYLHDAIKVLGCDVFELEIMVENHDGDLFKINNNERDNSSKIDGLTDKIEWLENKIADIESKE